MNHWRMRMWSVVEKIVGKKVERIVGKKVEKKVEKIVRKKWRKNSRFKSGKKVEKKVEKKSRKSPEKNLKARKKSRQKIERKIWMALTGLRRKLSFCNNCVITDGSMASSVFTQSRASLFSSYFLSRVRVSGNQFEGKFKNNKKRCGLYSQVA